MNSGQSGVDSKMQVDMGCVSEVELTAFAVVLGAKSKEMIRTKDEMTCRVLIRTLEYVVAPFPEK